MLTIFSIPKPFRDHIKVIQTNAIHSWMALRPACEVILFGDEEGTAETASKLGIRHIPDVGRNEYGTPLVNFPFDLVQEIGSYPLMCFVNADIILMSDFLKAVNQIEKRAFLLVGQRWDIDLPELLDFSQPDWEAKLQSRVKKMGALHGISGIDYFVFTKGLYRNIPPFAIGRPGWDNWMIYHARSLRVPVIDITRAVTVVHPSHAGHTDYIGGEEAFWEGPEAQRNISLLGDKSHAFSLDYATFLLTPKGLRPALTFRHLYFRMRALPVLYPRFRFFLTPFKIFERLVITTRSVKMP